VRQNIECSPFPSLNCTESIRT